MMQSPFSASVQASISLRAVSPLVTTIFSGRTAGLAANRSVRNRASEMPCVTLPVGPSPYAQPDGSSDAFTISQTMTLPGIQWGGGEAGRGVRYRLVHEFGEFVIHNRLFFDKILTRISRCDSSIDKNG